MKFILPLIAFAFSGFSVLAQTEADPAAPAPAGPPTNEWDAGDRPNSHLDVARFRWWAPGGAKDLRGVMMIIPGKNGDGRGAVDNPSWRAFAEKVRFALIGAQLQHSNGEYQSDPDGGTAEVLEKAVEKLAAANGWPQLKSAPIAFWGHSAGSNTGERFAFRNPKRVVALVSIKGTWGPGEYSKEKGDIPYLVCTGSKDKADWVKSSCGYYEMGKDKKALWTQALHPTEGHEEGKTKELALVFLTSATNLRMDPPSESGPPSSRLKDLNPSSGWMGDPKTLEIAAYADFKGKKKEAVWLPDEESAKAWKVYMQP